MGISTFLYTFRPLLLGLNEPIFYPVNPSILKILIQTMSRPKIGLHKIPGSRLIYSQVVFDFPDKQLQGFDTLN